MVHHFSNPLLAVTFLALDGEAGPWRGTRRQAAAAASTRGGGAHCWGGCYRSQRVCSRRSRRGPTLPKASGILGPPTPSHHHLAPLPPPPSLPLSTPGSVGPIPLLLDRVLLQMRRGRTWRAPHGACASTRCSATRSSSSRCPALPLASKRAATLPQACFGMQTDLQTERHGNSGGDGAGLPASCCLLVPMARWPAWLGWHARQAGLVVAACPRAPAPPRAARRLIPHPPARPPAPPDRPPRRHCL